ncbi:MAG: hypothetical protein IKS21_07650, partial [Oscillospiraceae bacterium]|nr:hypothetical protein [Oscillospiraceae bacterium]
GCVAWIRFQRRGVRGVVDAAPYTGMPFRVVARAISPQAGRVVLTRSQRWGAAGFALRQIAFVPNAGAMWAYFVTLRVRPLRWGADGRVPSLWGNADGRVPSLRGNADGRVPSLRGNADGNVPSLRGNADGR